MITYKEGNLLEAGTEGLVNTVNCVGIMGKGIALQFRQAFPNNYKQYERACRTGLVRLGQMFVVPVPMAEDATPRYIINFPTKQHWKNKSKLVDIQSGLISLVDEVKHLELQSVAVPPLGCGNGGLDWNEVRPLIEQAASEVPNVNMLVYQPQLTPEANTMPVSTLRPKLTRPRALLIKLVELYSHAGDKLTKLEIQKLAYFLQSAGEPLRLNYEKKIYGPYAENLNHVLQRLEGHYIRGYGDRIGPTAIYLLPDASKEADLFLADDAEAINLLSRVASLIGGYESRHGLELLSSVHWVTENELGLLPDPNFAVQAVHHWNPRKRTMFQPEQIRQAWNRLYEQGWIGAKVSMS